jgi:aminoglycoside phosphotransferase (APT) family kinase protein
VIDSPALERWFADHIPQSAGSLQFRLIAGGHSNLTYRVDDSAGNSYALRRPPLGDHPRGAHDVAREYRIQQALRDSAVPVPRMFGLCANTAVIGAPFYVMQWVNGPIVDSPAKVDTNLPDIATRRRATEALIDALAALHRVNVDEVGLGDLGPREHYLPRQLERMRKVWAKTKTRDLPLIESLHERLVARCPPQRYTGIVHADYRFGNVILGAGGTLAAILDWELCALGDVLVDIGGLLTNWDGPDDAWHDVWMQRAPTRAGGFPSREDLIARYTAQTGFDVAHIDYYGAFFYWRLAVIAEGMKRRYETGAMSTQSVDLAVLARRVTDRAERASALLDRC